MLGLGAWEMGMVLLVALVVLGPEKLPEVARKMARFVGQARRVLDDVRRNVDEALHEHDAAEQAEPPKALFTSWVEEQQQKHGLLSQDAGAPGAQASDGDAPPGNSPEALSEVTTPAGLVQTPEPAPVREVATPAGLVQTPAMKPVREVATPAGLVQTPAMKPVCEVVTPAGLAQTDAGLADGQPAAKPSEQNG